MRQSEVKLGAVYAVKVSGTIVPVCLIAVNGYGGWDGRNETTGRVIRIKTAAKLRFEVAFVNGTWKKI